MEGITYSFEKLTVWQEAKCLVVEVYHLLDKFPQFEKFALCDQIRRAIVSVPSNIAEGSGRKSLKEQKHFLEIAYGSLMEAFSQLQIAQDLGYIAEEDVDTIRPSFISLAKMLSGLKGYFER